MDHVYLDHNATSMVKPAVADAIVDAITQGGNASSVHGIGRKARRRVEDARAQVAALINASVDEIVFTSGGTEANNLAIKGAVRAMALSRVIVSAVEHPAVLDAAAGSGVSVEVVPVDADGVVDLVALKSRLEGGDGRALVSIMLANNETGVLQPVEQISELAHGYNAVVHCDAVQAAGKIPVDMKHLGADMLSISAHKIGGPQGVGALAVKDVVRLSALAEGGGQERGIRGGTENIPGIAGFGRAAELAVDGLNDFARLAELRDRMEAAVLEIAPSVQMLGKGVDRLPNTSCFTAQGMTGETQVMTLDLDGVAVSSGSACASGKVQASHVLKAMGADNGDCALRVSLGWNSIDADVEKFIQAWSKCHAQHNPKQQSSAA